jgi:hypothetical protein
MGAEFTIAKNLPCIPIMWEHQSDVFENFLGAVGCFSLPYSKPRMVILTCNHIQISYILITDLMHIIIYSYNNTSIYMFRAINAHLQEATLYICSTWYRHSLRVVVVADRYTD